MKKITLKKQLDIAHDENKNQQNNNRYFSHSFHLNEFSISYL